MPQNPHYNQGLLWRALIISLLLHVVLMLQTVTLPSIFPDASRKLLSARLTLRALLPAANSATDDLSPRPPLRRLTPKQQVRPVTPPAVSQEPADQVSVSQAAITEPLAVASTSPPGIATDGRAAAANPALSTLVQTLDADIAESKKAYLFAIAAEARRVKKYPPRALAAGWGGTAYIGIVVNMGGNVQTPVLDKSSGHDDIDNAAITMVRAALAKSPLPESLRKRSFELILPVVFNLNEQ